MSTAATEIHLACINCTSTGGRTTKIPNGWTRVREYPDKDDETAWFTHVGYCPKPECQAEAAEEAKGDRLLFH